MAARCRAVVGALPAADRPSLLVAADRAMAWILEYGDAEGDGDTFGARLVAQSGGADLLHSSAPP
jgi:hypothetical protein